MANQLQLSITHAPLIAQGVAMNMAGHDQAVDRTLGALDYCRLHDITVQAWSPFQYGFFDGVFVGNDKFPEVNKALDEVAEAYSVSPSAVAAAWLLRHPASMQVVLGTTKPSRVRDISKAADISLSRADWYKLYLAAGNELP